MKLVAQAMGNSMYPIRQQWLFGVEGSNEFVAGDLSDAFDEFLMIFHYTFASEDKVI